MARDALQSKISNKRPFKEITCGKNEKEPLEFNECSRNSKIP